MSNARISQVSFSRGELCPPLYNRTDIEQYSIGLKTLKNGFVHQEGCVSNRAGLEYVGEVKDSSKKVRLIPFTFNSEQTYIIEAGENYFRFIQDGGYILHGSAYGGSYIGQYSNQTTGTNDNNETYYRYSIDTEQITDAQLQEYIYLKQAIAVGQTVYLDENFETVYISENNSLAQGKVSKIQSSTVYIDYDVDEYPKRNQIAEIETPYLSKDLQRLKFAQSADILTITHLSYEPRELARYDHDRWQLSPIVFEPSITPPQNVTATWSTTTPTTNARMYWYLVTAVDENTLEESKRSSAVSCTGHREAYWTTSEYMTISWSAVSGASEYNVYRAVNGIYAYIGTSKNTSFTDDNIEPDLSETAPIQRNPFSNNNNPSCCAYYQQRKIYANTVKNPQTLFASQTATSNNFNCSRPLVASDAVDVALADREVNEIMHLIPFKDLIALTTNSEYKINGADGKFEANPMPVAIIQSSYGSSHVSPVVSGNMVLFVENGGTVLRELGYDYLSDSYDGDELSLFASHLFENKEIIYIAYAKAPYRIVYVVFNDGSLATLTYNKKQKLCGWGRQETQGKYESVAVIREGNQDVAYFVIKRKINGSDVRYVERTKTRIIDNAKTGFLVDSGLSAHFNTAVTTISGLTHLINTDVIVLADGGVYDDLTVSSTGTLTLPRSANDVIIGLPYEFEFETLGVEGENTHGLKKQINTVTINILNSREDFFVIGNQGHETQLARSLTSINDSGYLFSGKKEATPLNTPTDKASIHIKQKYPLPLTIAAVSAVVNIEDISDAA